MTAVAPKTPAAPTRTALPVLSPPVIEEIDTEWWVAPVKWFALVVFIAVPLFSLLLPNLAGRVVWTVVVAALPLFIVLVGYHRWRNICPLAFFARLPTLLRRPGARRASQQLEAIYYYVAFAIFFISLWLRLVATNGDGFVLALFFVALSLTALVVGALYTGKTWCNYFCPLSFIEKIYTEPHGLRETPNSQCPKCTACKRSCPDISEENGYWKEIGSKPKRFVYFAFPGLVFAFYFYYFLQAGSWTYYFGGSWTNEPDLWRTAFLPGVDARTAGFFFLPQVPRALASLFTLGAGALLSGAIFPLIEMVIRKRTQRRDPYDGDTGARHLTLALAAFAAFVTFYTFAGAPTLHKLPWGFPHLFLIVVVLTATLFLLRRLQRTQTDFAEETLARNIIKRWQWGDMQPPKNLREAFLVHRVRTQEKTKGATRVVDIYRESVREALDDGFVTREEVQMLETLRSQLQINDGDHERVMLALAEEERSMLKDPLQHPAPEKRLQLQTYARALGTYFERVLAADDNPNKSFIRQMRREYRVTKEEHEAVLKRLLGDAEGLGVRLAQEVGRIESTALTIQELERSPSPTHELLCYSLRRAQARTIGRLLHGLSFMTVDESLMQQVRESLSSDDAVQRAFALNGLRASLPPQVAERLIAARKKTSSQVPAATLADLLRQRLDSADAYVRALALFALFEQGAAGGDLLLLKSRDESDVMRETAEGLLERAREKNDVGVSVSPLLTVEKMIALRGARIFQQLSPESLAALARASSAEKLPPGTTLCKEGDVGNEVFILLDGDVRVFKHDGAREDIVGGEIAGGLIGEMAVLDPAPRSATVIAGDRGVRVLRLDGVAFRQALSQYPSIAAGVIRTLARRLRDAQE